MKANHMKTYPFGYCLEFLQLSDAAAANILTLYTDRFVTPEQVLSVRCGTENLPQGWWAAIRAYWKVIQEMGRPNAAKKRKGEPLVRVHAPQTNFTNSESRIVAVLHCLGMPDDVPVVFDTSITN